MDRISLKKIIKEQFPDNLQDPICNWLDWDKNPETWKQVAKLVEARNVPKLSEMFSQRQCFGTAGIRGLMEPGFNGMNDLVIIQTSQGLAKYLIQQKDKNNKNNEKIIVVGFDGRHHSMDFAKYTAKVFLESGFKVGLFSKIVPTPFVAFATKILSASAGIMITASHNPKQYNGYKVFAENGAQILSPHDENIQISILENLKPWNDKLWNISNMNYESESLFDPLSMIIDEYYKAINKSANHLDWVKKSDLRITYTALHGVGHDYLTKVFQTLGFKNYFPVISQKDPDPEFPTVEFPNPEEGQGVFDEAINTANKNDCSLIFANDPDSDRFCMAELQINNNEKTWRIFNGNEIGAFFGWWLWKQFDESSASSGFNKSDCYMISSAVSSKILQTLARKEKFNFMETLTGFKWMANHAYDLETKLNKKVLFCFEEAIGFMVGTTVFDKDGISATATILQLASYLETKGQTFTELLTQIYQKYGFHYSLNSYYLIYDSVKIKKIFDRIPNIMGPGQYIQSVDNIKVTRIRDLIKGFDSSTADQKPTLPKSCMVTFYFENGSTITFRTSGTEPKIKYYSEIIAQPDESDWEKVKLSHQRLIEQVVQAILEPEKNGLIAKKN